MATHHLPQGLWFAEERKMPSSWRPERECLCAWKTTTEPRGAHLRYVDAFVSKRRQSLVVGEHRYPAAFLCRNLFPRHGLGIRERRFIGIGTVSCDGTIVPLLNNGRLAASFLFSARTSFLRHRGGGLLTESRQDLGEMGCRWQCSVGETWLGW